MLFLNTGVLSKWWKAVPVSQLAFCLHSGKRPQCLLPSLPQYFGSHGNKTQVWEQKRNHGVPWSKLSEMQGSTSWSQKVEELLDLYFVAKSWVLVPAPRTASAFYLLTVSWKMDNWSLKQQPEHILPLEGDRSGLNSLKQIEKSQHRLLFPCKKFSC